MLTVSETAELLRSFDRVLILTHIRPDGDTVGCAAGLCAALRALGKTAFLLPNPGLTDTTAPYFAPYAAPAEFTPAKAVSVDIAAVGLFPDNAKPYIGAVDLAIDHHPSFEGFGKANIVRPEAAACGELILDIIRELTPVTPEIALPLYVAISTDTGVLPVFVGQATRAVEFAENGEKEYIAGLRLGLVTNTQDTSGETLETHPVTADRKALEALLPRFTGPIQQIPPMYSAIKIGGQKLYDLARKGKEVERKPRSITIFELELLEQVNETDYLLRCRCSKGTYLRTLCHDIGQALGCGGAMYSLRRTMAAGFTLAEAVSLEAVQAQGAALLRPADSLFAAYPAYRLTSAGKEKRVRNGNPITAEVPEGTYRVYGANGEFLCLSRAKDGTLTSIKNFFGA